MMGRVLVANTNPGTASWAPTGIASIAAGDTSATVALPTGSTYTGALVSFAAAPGTSAKVYASVSGTTLTITLDAAPGGAGTSVAYLLID